MKFNYLDINPSELNSAIRCRRQFVLQRTRQKVDTGFRVDHTEPIKTLLPEDCLFEVWFPQGFRIDAWLPSEGLAIEYKSGKPHKGDVYQCWLIIATMHLAGVPDFSMQLWSGSEYHHNMLALSALFGYPIRPVDSDFIAMRIDYDKDIQGKDLERQLHRLRNIDLDKLPPAKDFVQCKGCFYEDYCHID
jgi:hypothetical protein